MTGERDRRYDRPMGDFSIEIESERIDNPRTREYFREVYRCYTDGSHRSAVVMLWSVVICDLLFKVQELDSLGDPTGRAIVTEITGMQQAKPHSPEWEERLVTLVQEKTHLLDASERVNIDTLQKHRHLSAHPVMTAATYELFSPNRETVRAHIRNALEAVLTKPALMSRKIWDAFAEDLERIATVLPYEMGDDGDLRRYLDERYFRRLAPAVLEKIFRSLWRMVFRSTDARCEKSRPIFHRALRLLYAKRTELFDAIAADADWYSDIAHTGSPMKELVSFLAVDPRVYGRLREASKVLVRTHAEADADLGALAWFLSPSLTAHFDAIRTKQTNERSYELRPETMNRLAARATDEGQLPAFRDLAVFLYGKSWTYDTADKRFKHMVEPHLAELTDAQLRGLLAGIEANNQTYNRGRASTEHPKIKEACDRVLGANFDYGPFPRFIASLPQQAAAAQ